MAAPASFFNIADTGTTVNRFSQGISIIGSELHLALFNTIILAFGLVGSARLVASSSSYAALAFPPIAVVFYFLQKYYLRTWCKDDSLWF
jgi:ATP-binding cassette subfamily C (CFTR/MRP) protein 1